jgi:hypothetical protein
MQCSVSQLLPLFLGAISAVLFPDKICPVSLEVSALRLQKSSGEIYGPVEKGLLTIGITDSFCYANINIKK